LVVPRLLLVLFQNDISLNSRNMTPALQSIHFLEPHRTTPIFLSRLLSVTVPYAFLAIPKSATLPVVISHPNVSTVCSQAIENKTMYSVSNFQTPVISCFSCSYPLYSQARYDDASSSTMPRWSPVNYLRFRPSHRRLSGASGARRYSAELVCKVSSTF
jgi:hypothetical protein